MPHREPILKPEEKGRGKAEENRVKKGTSHNGAQVKRLLANFRKTRDTRSALPETDLGRFTNNPRDRQPSTETFLTGDPLTWSLLHLDNVFSS